MTRKILIVFALIALATSIAPAQITTGTVTGTVSDSSGAVMAGVEVRLTNVGTGITQRQTSDAGGNFRFLLLPSGTYKLEANMAGFKSFTREGIIVQVDRSLGVSVIMDVGQVTEKVVVTAGADLLEPNTSSLGSVMDGRKVEELPINGRNPMALANLIPTVRGVGGFGGYTRSTWGVSAVSIAGGQPLSVGYLVDGVANDKMIDSGGITVLTVEGTQEFKVQTNALSAEFGRSAGGVISVVSKSGTNQFHMKWGFEHRLYRRNDWGPSEAYGNYNFTRGFTQGPNPLQASAAGGYGVASLLLGYPASAAAGYTTDQTRSFNVDALYMQNDWKVTRRLTLNMGVRWEYEGPVKDRYNVASNFDPFMQSPLQAPGLNLRGGLVYPGTNGIDRGLVSPDRKDFEPRLGFAYQAMRWLVVRGGYGIMHVPTTGVGYTTTGFSTSTAMITSADGGLTPYDTLSNPFPSGILKPTGSKLGAMTGIGTGIGGQLRDVGTRGYVQQWNLTVQFEPKPNWLVEAAWVGNHGVRNLFYTTPLNYLSDANQALGSQLVQSMPNPFYGIITTGTLSTRTITRRQLLLPYPQFTSVSAGYAYLGNSIYHAAAFKLEKRFSQGFSILTAYTISKALDDGENRGQIRPGAATSTAVQNWNNMRAERSKSIWDVPQRLVLTALWDLPFGKTGSPAVRYVIGGWQANAIATIESGTPISLAASVTGGGNRPHVVPGVSAKLEHQTLEKWFNTAAFSQPADYTYGNVSRTLPDVLGPGMCTLDASLFKSFRITESKRVEFRAEAFNLTNTPTFDTPGRTLNSATFGVITATQSNLEAHPRNMQFALRFIF